VTVDLVLFNRNSHPQGLIGPIDPGALDEDRTRAVIRDCPLVTDPDRWRAERPLAGKFGGLGGRRRSHGVGSLEEHLLQGTGQVAAPYQSRRRR